MPVPHVSTNFADVLDIRFKQIFDDELEMLQDMLPNVYTMEGTNGRNDMRWSEIGTMTDFIQFNGSVDFGSQNQGFDVTLTPVEFTRGIQVERLLFENDQFQTMNQRPAALANAAHRTRQRHGALIFNSAFTDDSGGLFYDNTENVALCADSHTTNSGASTANGFDNLGTAALTATAVQAARLQMRGFRGDQADRISVVPDELFIPPDLEEEGYEIIASAGKVDTANNNANIHQGRYRMTDWEYMMDTSNWFLSDSGMRRKHVHWSDRIPLEFAFVEDFDSIIAKWRGYMVYGLAHTNWRWVMGHQVS